MDRKTCFFIGHREVSEDIFLQLSAEIEGHITECGVTDFVVGRYGRFDSMAVRCVKATKKRHPEVTLTLLMLNYPCTGHDVARAGGIDYVGGMWLPFFKISSHLPHFIFV